MVNIERSEIIAALRQRIALKSRSYAFKLGTKEVKCLDLQVDIPIQLGTIYVQLVHGENNEEFYLFKLKKDKVEKEYQVKNGELLIKGKKLKVEILSVDDISKELEEQEKNVKTSSTLINASNLTSDNKSKGVLFKKEWNIDDDIKKKIEDDREFKRAQDNLWYRKIGGDISESNQICFTTEVNFQQSDDFWRELSHYYRRVGKDLENKISLIYSKDLPPVFSKREYQNVNLKSLHDAVAEKIKLRISELDENRESIRKQLIEAGDRLIRRGVKPEDSDDYNKLFLEQKTISDCIHRAFESLDKYSEYIKNIGEQTEHIVNKSVIDIEGNREIISKHYEKITDKLIQLNLDISSIQKYQLALEHELIKRLQDVEDARGLQDWIAKLEREQLLKDYQDENRENLDRQEKLDIYRELGSINENAAFIQQKIEEEKKKINYYMDNLKSLSSYGNYEVGASELIKRKRKLRNDTLRFRREMVSLRNHILRKEKKHDDFFKHIDKEISELRSDVFCVIKDNNELVDQCLKSWNSQWDQEGIPMVEDMFSRTSKIVEAFAPLPATHIIKLHQLKQKIIEEVSARQKEWKRVFEEIKSEFKAMNYELDTPLPSELDNKHLAKIDSAKLTLSEDVKKAVFWSPNAFQLSEHTDLRIGLNPRTMDDDSFIVIDQVWEELTPEQEEELAKRLELEKEEERFDMHKKNKEFLIKEQLDSIKNRFVAQMAKLEPYSKAISPEEKTNKYRDIEGEELHIWKRDNYLISNSRGQFSDALYEITKKLFSLKSVRLVDKHMEFTDDGFVKDGHTEILSSRDYFIKSEEKIPFVFSEDEIDLSESVDIHNQNMIEELSDPEYVSHMKEREERLSKLTEPIKPSISEWAQISLKKYQEEKDRVYDVEQLRGRLLEMQDEIAALKNYHDQKISQLDKAASDRNESFDALKEEISKAKDYLLAKDQELNSIFKKAEQDMNVKIETELESQKTEKPDPLKSQKHGLAYWLNRFIYGLKDKDSEDDFTTE